ncbi:transcription termination/antitermination protein NusG [Pelagibius marinus]|uniref:transcription termination/antitermination protein NusG n=1 Tax=Pelagibius marinus TaxID=2762760 RepID=UPI001872EA65|nr:hypothetical protein [Pelagibius marinus]
MSTHSGPAIEDDDEADSTRLMLDVIELQPKGFCKGEAPRIVSGALAGRAGCFEKMADRKRGVLLLDLLGRKVRVETPPSSLAAGA